MIPSAFAMILATLSPGRQAKRLDAQIIRAVVGAKEKVAELFYKCAVFRFIKRKLPPLKNACRINSSRVFISNCGGRIEDGRPISPQGRIGPVPHSVNSASREFYDTCS